MYYYGARYYNPRVSLWLNVDPLAEYNPFMNNQAYIDGEHNVGVYNSGNNNPYIYCYQNPINYTDPNGKQTGVWEIPAVVYLVGAVVAVVAAYNVSEAAKKADFSRYETPPVYRETIPAKSPKITREEIFRDKKESLRAEIYPAAKKDKLTIRTFPAEEKKKISFFSMFEPVGNKYINQEVKKVVNGQGTPREEEDGSQKVFRGDGYARDSKKYGSQKNWVGSLEWDVPKSNNVHDRILERTNKDGSKSYGYSESADYEKIYEIKQK
ncbi:hypothetical protein MTQ02_12015 [Chryseobacterium rhizosphaerae]|jgi:hypothetical protein|nr:hypothetical protein [Chryseobacterium rhizosphaerae]